MTLAAGEFLKAEGRYVSCRSDAVTYRIKRVTRNFLGRYTSGEGRVRVFSGPGELLLNPAPYWRQKIFTEHGGDPDCSSRAVS